MTLLPSPLNYPISALVSALLSHLSLFIRLLFSSFGTPVSFKMWLLVELCVFTHLGGSGSFKGALQEVGPEVRQGLVQVESGAPVVLSQVGVEISIETSVLGVQGAERRERLLEGALRTSVQFSEIG